VYGCGVFCIFREAWKMMRIVKESVKNGLAHDVALELDLNYKKQNVPNALGLHLNFAIFPPPHIWGICS